MSLTGKWTEGLSMKLSFEEIELIQRALMSHRWKIEDQQGQEHQDFTASAQLMDKLSVNHNGAEINFISNRK